MAEDGLSVEQRRRLRETERRVGELTLDNDILRAAARKEGSRSAGEAAEVSTELHAPLPRARRALDALRSTACYRRRYLRLVTAGLVGERPGANGVSDHDPPDAGSGRVAGAKGAG